MSSDGRKTLQGTAVTPPQGTETADAQTPAEPRGLPVGPVIADPSEAAPEPGVPAAAGMEAAAPEPSVPAASVQPSQQPSAAPGAAKMTQTANVETLSGKFIRISLWRAFRLRIHVNEILASERKQLAVDAPHVVDPEQQAFLAWRRSVLLLVAISLVPLTILRLTEALEGPPMPTGARAFLLCPAIAEALLCLVAFDQLKNWTRWSKQRRVLFYAWGLYMLAPFIVYLYPFRHDYGESFKMAREAAEFGGLRLKLTKENMGMAVGFSSGIRAHLALGPKVISLMPGLIRASVVSKLLFPGMSAPGWLMILSAPFYALFVYIIILLPYQVTGSWLFLVGSAGLVMAQIFIAWSGQMFTTPLDTDDAQHRIHKAWMAYILLMVVSAAFLLFGISEFFFLMNFNVLQIFSSVLSILSGILLLTLIFTDGIVGGMVYFRKRVYPDPRREELLRASEEKLDRFAT